MIIPLLKVLSAHISKIVRVPFSHAEWYVVAVGNTLQVTYTIKIDPGGSMPAWLVNMSMADGLYLSFNKL